MRTWQELQENWAHMLVYVLPTVPQNCLLALSTGRFPPTPIDQSAAKLPMAAKVGLPAAANPNTAVMPMVRLKAHRLPKMSQPNPQNTAPTRRPIFWDRVRKGGLVGLNSLLTGVNISEVTIGQRLSIAHPNPMTMKSWCTC